MFTYYRQTALNRMKIIPAYIFCLVANWVQAAPYQNDGFGKNPTHTKQHKVILPSRYGINNNGTLINKTNLYAWLDACKKQHSRVYFPAGKYLLPADAEYDFGNNDLHISGDGPDKTIISTNGGPESNFSIPEKINLTESRLKRDGIYQVDITAATVHRDYIAVSDAPLDSYIQIIGNQVKAVNLQTVKTLGYVTELDTEGPDPGIDGIYVVAKHARHEYGGGFAHLTLDFPGSALYLQGTILQRKNGIWSRYYSSVAFIAGGNFSVKNICFSNFRPYLFLPAAKKRNALLKTSDHFIIENCRFEHSARILATMAYAGISESPEWYKASSHYPIDGKMRFKHFVIKGNEFRYIHESISWGTPPAISYKVINNQVHDCYTLLTCFYLFPPYNTSLRVPEKSTFSISGNTFKRIRALNAGSENTVHLIRTINKGIISNNRFTDCTGIHLYLNGSTRVINNVIRAFMADGPAKYSRPPLILVKLARDKLISISNNAFSFGMMGNLVANESLASFVIYNNKLDGAGIRYLSDMSGNTGRLDMYKSYIVQNLSLFKTLAGKGNYDTSISLNNMIYFNKRRGRWEIQQNHSPMYLYSEVNNLAGNKQFVNFTGNVIETGYLTRIQKTSAAIFNSVSFTNNRIAYCTGLNAGNKHTVINRYVFSGNAVQNGSLNMTSLGNVSLSARNVQISNNVFTYDTPVSYSFSASDSLIFHANVFNGKTNTHESIIQNTGQLNKAMYPVSTGLLMLTGHPGQVMEIYNNKFGAEMTKGNILQITNPDKLSIKENEFNMKVQASPVKTRNAIFINSGSDCSSINITGNRYFPETGKENYLVRFDDAATVIHEITVSRNQVKSNAAFVEKTIEASHKTFINYYRENTAPNSLESIKKVEKRISIK